MDSRIAVSKRHLGIPNTPSNGQCKGCLKDWVGWCVQSTFCDCILKLPSKISDANIMDSTVSGLPTYLGLCSDSGFRLHPNRLSDRTDNLRLDLHQRPFPIMLTVAASTSSRCSSSKDITILVAGGVCAPWTNLKVRFGGTCVNSNYFS